MTTHADVRTDPLIAEHANLIQRAVEHLADAQNRHRGTFGGALAHADPADDLGAPALAMQAELMITRAGGERTVAAPELFQDFITTAIGDQVHPNDVRTPQPQGSVSHHVQFALVVPQQPILRAAPPPTPS